MIKQVILLLSALTISCTCIKKSSIESNIEQKSAADCPTDGDCTTVLFENKSLSIKTDDIGSIYYTLNDNLETSVIKFEYNKKIDTTLQDNSYREEVLFEIPNSFNITTDLQNNELQSVKMIYGKHCFCRGQAGIYKVNQGKLNIIKDKNQIYFETDFEIPNIDQKIKKIKSTVNY
ncbi:hypothetical protein ACFSX9_06435 [Flavobacterium ardleyense]|uniref:Lipoprotein n=1 Tax=Flavobacterium ardleyense TaxID=2038737 RepID=A0ABW5Z6P0_9FLAO